ncbi:hypothetical protein [Streptomyces mirabilis]|uniref:hypothetical protein n=1 Tax=Streptomyces mirabilis TaxID=68239 RepID=UPI0033CCEEE1
MVAGERNGVRSGGLSLLADFKQLSALPSAHKCGYQLEALLEQRYRRAHFRVVRNASIAKPRQTDLVARYGDTWYLIEAKWHSDPADIDIFDTVRSRMERALCIHGCWECPAYPTPSTHRGDLEELVLGRQHSHARTDYKLVQLPVTGYRLVIATRLKAFINVDSQATAET